MAQPPTRRDATLKGWRYIYTFPAAGVRGLNLCAVLNVLFLRTHRRWANLWRASGAFGKDRAKNHFAWRPCGVDQSEDWPLRVREVRCICGVAAFLLEPITATDVLSHPTGAEGLLAHATLKGWRSIYTFTPFLRWRRGRMCRFSRGFWCFFGYPALTRWANLWRASGAFGRGQG